MISKVGDESEIFGSLKYILLLRRMKFEYNLDKEVNLFLFSI